MGASVPALPQRPAAGRLKARKGLSAPLPPSPIMPHPSYFRCPGDVLTSAEVAHLLTRAAAGEVLPCLPVKTAKGWTLQSAAALDDYPAARPL